jgi:hypothetical protein
MTCLNAFYRLAIPPAWTGRLEPMPKKSNNKGVEAIFCKFKKIVRKNVHKNFPLVIIARSDTKSSHHDAFGGPFSAQTRHPTMVA